MKKILIFIFSILFYSCSAQYGAAVTHRSGTPTAVKNYAVKPSLLDYDIIEQALWVNNPEFGYYKLMSPQMRYLRGFININFGNNQIIQYSFIHSQLQSQSLSNNVLNGLYIVKFTVAGGTITDIAEVDMSSIPNLILAPSSYLISNNDFLIIRYERGILKSCQQIIDKTRFKVQQIDDSIRVHRNEIDSLKGQKNTPSVQSKLDSFLAKHYVYVPFPMYRCRDTLKATTSNIHDTNEDGNFLSVPPQMVGDTLIGVSITICKASPNKMQMRLLKVDQYGTVSYINNFQSLQIYNVEPNTFYSYYEVRPYVLTEASRILPRFFGYVTPVLNDSDWGQGLSFTFVIKPKLK